MKIKNAGQITILLNYINEIDTALTDIYMESSGEYEEELQDIMDEFDNIIDSMKIKKTVAQIPDNSDDRLATLFETIETISNKKYAKNDKKSLIEISKKIDDFNDLLFDENFLGTKNKMTPINTKDI